MSSVRTSGYSVRPQERHAYDSQRRRLPEFGVAIVDHRRPEEARAS
jgi:hypothetical protein